MTPLEPRLVLGLTAEVWVIVALVLAALVAAYWEVVDLLGSTSAVRTLRKVPWPERRSSIQAWQHEATKARSGLWR